MIEMDGLDRMDSREQIRNVSNMPERLLLSQPHEATLKSPAAMKT